jgi:hypothetical protein
MTCQACTEQAVHAGFQRRKVQIGNHVFLKPGSRSVMLHAVPILRIERFNSALASQASVPA